MVWKDFEYEPPAGEVRARPKSDGTQ
jgi:hypothetical protein